MRVPFTPLSNPIPIEFNEKYHRYSADGHSNIPSVTSILKQVSSMDFSGYRMSLGRKHFQKFNKNIVIFMDTSDKENCQKVIGEILGDFDMSESGNIGNQTHLRTEQYDNQSHFTPIDALASAHFDRIKPFLDELTEIYAIEQPLTNKEYSYAGKPDRVGLYRGKRTMLDFKTKKSVRKREWLEDHFIQEAAYTVLWEANGGAPIEQFVLLVSSRDNQSIGMEFIEEDPKPWIEKWNEILNKFNNTL